MFSNVPGRGVSSVSVKSWFVTSGVVMLLSACGQPQTASDAGPAGGFVQGALDTHCTQPDGGAIIQATSMAVCHLVAADAGAADFPPPGYNSEGDDNDCKYHLKVSSTAVRQNQDVTFTVVGTNKTDGTPMTGADTMLEGFLSDTHPAPNSGITTTESPNGTYAVGPVKFDAPGRWTVRFHFFHHCTDVADDSPHGHVAFYVDVP
jgi:hypothetical protein